MKFTATTLLYGAGATLFFNCGMWQLYRRQWKKRLLESQQTLNNHELTELPPPGTPVPPMYQRVAIEGTFDFKGSVLVGPRQCPDLVEGKSGLPSQLQSATGSKKWGDSPSGFFVFTPFRVAKDQSLLLVNIGWVPNDAVRSETHFQKYLRKTTKALKTLKGHILYEEDFASWWNLYTQGYHRKIGLSFPVIRPAEIATAYTDDLAAQHHVESGGEDMFLEASAAPVEENIEPKPELPPTHLPRHYYVTMYDEDDTARVVVDGEIFPKRSSAHHRRSYTISPNVHLQYAVFWFACSAISVRFLKRYIDHTIKMSKPTFAKNAAEKLSGKLDVTAKTSRKQ